VIDEVDKALVEDLRARRAGSFDRLYARHRERIWAFLVRLSGDRVEAEDLFQETWISAAKHVHALQAGSDVRAWLYAIARNKHRSARRFLLFDLRRREALAHEPMPASATPDGELERRQRLRAIENALESLSQAHREILILSVLEGLEGPSLAAALEIKEDAMRKRLSRARAELSEALALAEARTLAEARRSSS